MNMNSFVSIPELDKTHQGNSLYSHPSTQKNSGLTPDKLRHAQEIEWISKHARLRFLAGKFTQFLEYPFTRNALREYPNFGDTMNKLHMGFES
jgi:hypothetical protein